LGEHPLDKIVALIRARPTITVRELARELGYAEERSVYYWLHKAGYKGLRTLKREVLGGRDGRGEAKSCALGDEPPADKVQEAPLEAAPWVITVSTRVYEPWVRAGDELHIDPTAEPASGDLVLVDLPGEGDALRRCYLQPPSLLLAHPGDPRDWIDTGTTHARLKGVVIRLIRRRP